MSQPAGVQIDNPIINTPFKEPEQHFIFNETGITDQIASGRRMSGVYVPVPTKKGKNQLELEGISTTWTNETFKENEFVNRIRVKVSEWRSSNYDGATNVTKRLLQHWQRDERERRFFFCQIEALETIIYITEIAEKRGETWIKNDLDRYSHELNAGLFRIAHKMATGTGKTVLMSMIIAWQSINKAHYRQDTRFTDTFAVIAPGITIRDRLSVLQPNNPNNYYDALDIVPAQYKDFLNQAQIVVINFHTMLQRNIERYKGARVVSDSAKKESPAAMINRAFRGIKGKKNIIVLNDEAHHCYITHKTEEGEKLSGEEKREAEKNNEEARVWHNGLQALHAKLGVKMVVDVSATPYYLKGSGFPEGTLFPWVVSDFDLIDAIESGIVKIPRIPVRSDEVTKDDIPSYRHLWLHISDGLPKRGKKTGEYSDDPVLPTKLETALYSLYENYEKSYARYQESLKKNPNVMPPVMIVVCNNTTVSEMVYKWIAGYEKPEVERIIPGKLAIFRNEDGSRFHDRPSTFLIDSAAIESGEAVNDTFKQAFAHEIKEFHEEYARLYPGRPEPEDEEILREVMNTVGRKGKLGENIKCVVSVSMLTEGWDANTVTHVLGVRAFSTQLLCEQVVGRALRRVSYDVDETGKFRPEYAEVYGVPFLFMKTDGTDGPGPEPTAINRVRALEEREALEIQFPRLEGYRHEFDLEKLEATFSDSVKTTIENVPTKVVVSDVIGGEDVHTLESLKTKREQQVVYALAKYIIERYFSDKEGSNRFWLFPQVKNITAEYVRKNVKLKDNMFIGLLLLESYFKDAATNIYQAISASVPEKKVMPILAHYDTVGSTRYVDRITTKPVRETFKSHVNYVIADTGEWEQGVAKKLEDMDEVEAYVKNEGLEFYIPYEFKGASRTYIPDFIARIKTPDNQLLNLIIEVTGKKDEAKAIKVETARNLWVPAVNNYGKFGQWAFLEVQDIHETQNLIRFGLTNGFNSIK